MNSTFNFPYYENLQIKEDLRIINFTEPISDDYNPPVNYYINYINIYLEKKTKNLLYFEFKYNEAINGIMELIMNLGYSSDYENKYPGEYSPKITIYIPKKTSAKERIKIWDDLFEKILDFSKQNNYDFILNYLYVSVEREE